MFFFFMVSSQHNSLSSIPAVNLNTTIINYLLQSLSPTITFKQNRIYWKAELFTENYLDFVNFMYDYMIIIHEQRMFQVH